MSANCIHCDTETIIVRVAYVHNGMLFTSVPVRGCVNPDCIRKAGGTVVKHKSHSKPGVPSGKH